MGANLLTNYFNAAAVILFAIGFACLLFSRNLVKKVIGLNIATTAVYLFFAAEGYITGRAAPIISDGVQSASAYINPIPAGLMLTGIVISVSVTAFSFSIIVSLFKRYKTLDLDKIIELASHENSEAEQ